MTEVDKALRYIFILSFLLILVAYYVGTQGVATAFGGQLNSLLLTVTGRTSTGQFANYPGAGSSGLPGGGAGGRGRQGG